MRVREGANIWLQDDSKTLREKAQVLSLSGKPSFDNPDNACPEEDAANFDASHGMLVVSSSRANSEGVTILPRSLPPDHLRNLDDCIGLNEATVLQNLEVRHKHGQVGQWPQSPPAPLHLEIHALKSSSKQMYTFAGNILLSVNPYMPLQFLDTNEALFDVSVMVSPVLQLSLLTFLFF